jgi:hypothetical protein
MPTDLVIPAIPNAKSVLMRSTIASSVMINLWSQAVHASIHAQWRVISLKSELVSLAMLHVIIVLEQWTQCAVNVLLVIIWLRQLVIQSAIRPCIQISLLDNAYYALIIAINARWLLIAKDVRPVTGRCQTLVRERCSLDLTGKINSIWQWTLLSRI